MSGRQCMKMRHNQSMKSNTRAARKCENNADEDDTETETETEKKKKRVNYFGGKPIAVLLLYGGCCLCRSYLLVKNCENAQSRERANINL